MSLLPALSKVAAEHDDSCSPLLTIPVSPEVQTPRTTPPPLVASTAVVPERKRSRINKDIVLATEEATMDGDNRESTFQEALPTNFLKPMTPSVLAPAEAADRSSMGILSAETLAANLTASDTFVFPDVSAFRRANQVRARGVDDDEESFIAKPPPAANDVFKVPVAPVAAKKVQQGLPANFLAPTLAESSVASSVNSTHNQSSFAWEKILQQSDAENSQAEVSVLNPEVPVENEQFYRMNARSEETFDTGGFSARSTSFGGSNGEEGSQGEDGKDGGATLQERFSDYTQGIFSQSGPSTNSSKPQSNGLQELRDNPFDKTCSLARPSSNMFATSNTLTSTNSSKPQSNVLQELRDNPFDKTCSLVRPSSNMFATSHTLTRSAEHETTPQLVISKSPFDDSALEHPPMIDGQSRSLLEKSEKAFDELSQQDFSADFQGEFEGDQDVAKNMIDQDEQEFNEENKLELQDVSSYGGEEASCNFSEASRSPQAVSSDALSQSRYFVQNTSRLGGLSTSLSADERPNLGFGNIVSPQRREKKKAEAERMLKEMQEPQEVSKTFTVEGELDKEEEMPTEEKIVNKLKSFQGLDADALAKLIQEASPDLNAKAYANMIKNIMDQTTSVSPQDPNPAASVSQFLPSFLETSLADLTSQEEEEEEQQKDKNKGRFLLPPSQIPVRSPKQSSGSKPLRGKSPVSYAGSRIPVAQTSQRKRNPGKGPRFSSPIKAAQKQQAESSGDKNTAKRNLNMGSSEKENRDVQFLTPSAPNASRFPLDSNRKDLPVQKVTPTNKPISNLGAVGGKAVFPVQTDRAIISWLAVAAGRSEEQVITLRNLSDREMTLNLIVRESADFKLGLSSSKKISIGPLSTADVAITFSPSTGQFSSGKLVLKPQGVSGPGEKSLKATIRLQGQGGTPDIGLEGFGEVINGKRTLNIGEARDDSPLSWNMKISNTGSAPGFFKLQGFRDGDCRQKDSEYIVLDPYQGVLSAGEQCVIRATLNPSLVDCEQSRGLFLGCIALFRGPEICRQVMLKARQLPGAPRLSSSPALLCLDFTQEFSRAPEHQATFSGSIVPQDTKHFYDKTLKEVIDVIGRIEKVEEREFNALAIEETLSETRINCTVISPSRAGGKFSVIHEEEEEPARAAEAASRPARPIDKTVYLDKDEVYFPRPRVGNKVTSMVKLKNRTKEPHTLHVGSVKRPFFVFHTRVVVKPGSYLNLPVTYHPQTMGPHKEELIFKGKGGKVLRAVLSGNTSDK